MAFELNEGVVRRVLGYLKHGLTRGLGMGGDGKMCVQHVLSTVSGEGKGDDPSCVWHDLRDLMVTLNDAGWSSNAARAEGLKRLAIAEMGSAEWIRKMPYGQYAELKSRMGEAVRQGIEARVPVNNKAGPLISLRGFSQTGEFASLGHAIDAAARALGNRVGNDGYDLVFHDEAFDDAMGAFCEDLVGVFCDMGAPGAAYLPLTLQD